MPQVFISLKLLLLLLETMIILYFLEMIFSLIATMVIYCYKNVLTSHSVVVVIYCSFNYGSFLMPHNISLLTVPMAFSRCSSKKMQFNCSDRNFKESTCTFCELLYYLLSTIIGSNKYATSLTKFVTLSKKR